MKKVLIRSMILAMIFYGLAPSLLQVNAEEFIPSKDKVTNADQIYKVNPADIIGTSEKPSVTDQEGVIHEVDLEGEFGIKNDDLSMFVEESFDSGDVTIETNLDFVETKINSSLVFNEEQGQIIFTASTLESDKSTLETYYVTIDEIDSDENFIATFVDTETGASYELNTIDAQASILPALVIGLIAKQGIKWAIKKWGPKLLIKSFSKVAIKAAIKKSANFSVSNKHLSSATGRYAKFNTTSKSTVRSWIKEGLGKSSVSISLNNNKKLSFVIIANLGKKVGKKGETKIRIVVDYTGGIWTAYPVK